MIEVSHHVVQTAGICAVGIGKGRQKQLSSFLQLVVIEIVACHLALHIALHRYVAKGDSQLSGLTEADKATVIVLCPKNIAHVAQVVDEPQRITSPLVDSIGALVTGQ